MKMANLSCWMSLLGMELPPLGFAVEDAGFIAPAEDGSGVVVKVAPTSDRLQLLEPFVPIKADQLGGMRILDQSKRQMYHRPYFYGGSMVDLQGTPCPIYLTIH
jgi:hypothetical protein